MDRIGTHLPRNASSRWRIVQGTHRSRTFVRGHTGRGTNFHCTGTYLALNRSVRSHSKVEGLNTYQELSSYPEYLHSEYAQFGYTSKVLVWEAFNKKELLWEYGESILAGLPRGTANLCMRSVCTVAYYEGNSHSRICGFRWKMFFLGAGGRSVQKLHVTRIWSRHVNVLSKEVPTAAQDQIFLRTVQDCTLYSTLFLIYIFSTAYVLSHKAYKDWKVPSQILGLAYRTIIGPIISNSSLVTLRVI